MDVNGWCSWTHFRIKTWKDRSNIRGQHVVAMAILMVKSIILVHCIHICRYIRYIVYRLVCGFSRRVSVASIPKFADLFSLFIIK